MRVCGVIPARLAATRLPRKLLLCETGKPLIQHTWEAMEHASSLDCRIVAADSPEIVAAVEAFGGMAFLTGEHPSGTDRVAEVMTHFLPEAEIVVNIQGDEPEMEPTHVDRVVRMLSEEPTADIATLGTPIRHQSELDDPSCVKVVVSGDGRALYFSRAAIPFVRDRDCGDCLAAGDVWLRHLGLYAYRREALLRMTRLPASRLEHLEKLEQLRALEAGFRIILDVVEHQPPGIDTPEDYRRFVERRRRKAKGDQPRPQ